MIAKSTVIANESDEKFDARNRIILANLGLASKMVRKYKGLIEPEEIVGICSLGLVKAAEKNITEGGIFENYAYKCIKGHLFRALKKTLIISIPEYKWKDIAEFRNRKVCFLEGILDNNKKNGLNLSIASFQVKEPPPDLIVMAKEEMEKIKSEIKNIIDFIEGRGHSKKKVSIFKMKYGLNDGSLDKKKSAYVAKAHNMTRQGVDLALIRLWVKVGKRFPKKDEKWLKYEVERFVDMLDFVSIDDIEKFNLKF